MHPELLKYLARADFEERIRAAGRVRLTSSARSRNRRAAVANVVPITAARAFPGGRSGRTRAAS